MDPPIVLPPFVLFIFFEVGPQKVVQRPHQPYEYLIFPLLRRQTLLRPVHRELPHIAKRSSIEDISRGTVQYSVQTRRVVQCCMKERSVMTEGS